MQNEDRTGRRFEPKAAIRRILEAAAVSVPDKEAFWLGYHMERFVNYTREHGELLDFQTAADSYVAHFERGRGTGSFRRRGCRSILGRGKRGAIT